MRASPKSFVADELTGLGAHEQLFERLDDMEGRIYRQVAARRTFRFEVDGRGYFAKLHFGVGWKEIFKNLASLRLPVLGARNEWRAIHRLVTLGVATMVPVAFMETGLNPATRRSLIVTRELEDTVSLEDLVLQNPPGPGLKRRLIREVARLSAAMHAGGLNHRDLYICHFHLDRGTLDQVQPVLFLIDLHRAQLRRRTPHRWLVKDIGGLFFSAMDPRWGGLTRRDCFRFMRAYAGKPLRRTLAEDRRFWRSVARRAAHLYRDEHGAPPPIADPAS